jgi:PAS domain S-box-containing protein
MDFPDSLLEQSPDAVIFVDREGVVRVWNLRAEAVFGFSADEVLGQGLDTIIPEHLRRAHWEGFRKAIDTGNMKYMDRVLTTRSRHKSGRKLYVDLSFGLVRDAEGTVTGALATARDSTEAFLAQKTLQARASELEKKLNVFQDLGL